MQLRCKRTDWAHFGDILYVAISYRQKPLSVLGMKSSNASSASTHPALSDLKTLFLWKKNPSKPLNKD